MDFDITFCAGIKNILADRLSRLFVPDEEGKDNSTEIAKRIINSQQKDEMKEKMQKGENPLSKINNSNENKGQQSRKFNKTAPEEDQANPKRILQVVTRSASNNRADNVLSSLPMVNRRGEKVTKVKLKQVVDHIQEQNNVNEWLPTKVSQKEILNIDYIIPGTFKEREEILIKTHLLGHYGVTAMEKTIYNDNMNWPGLRKDILRTVAACKRCRLFNRGQTVYHPPTGILPDDVMDHVVMDLGTLNVTTPRGNNLILLMVDLFSRFTMFSALADKRATTIAKQLVQNFSIMGYCTIISHDRGLEFHNSLVDSLIKQCGIDH